MFDYFVQSSTISDVRNCLVFFYSSARGVVNRLSVSLQIPELGILYIVCLLL